MADVSLHFDPVCPWTWRVSRWLVDAAGQRGLTVEWRPFSLIAHNGGEVPEEHADEGEAEEAALRVLQALASERRFDDVLRLYSELGTRTHDRGARLRRPIVDEAVSVAGLEDWKGALDDPAWDEVVERATKEAAGSAGPGVGSPVLFVQGAQRAIHGPILAAVPGRDEAAALWDAVATLARSPVFFELKRGRR